MSRHENPDSDSRIIDLPTAARPAAAMTEDIYGLERWGDGLVKILDNGHIGLCQPDLTAAADGEAAATPCDLKEIMRNLKQRGITAPVLLRVTNFMKTRIDQINDSFKNAIEEIGYDGRYQGVFPVKVNQQAQVIDRIVEYGQAYDFGLEVGSKAELLIALAHDLPAQSAVICNGIKDSEFITLALMAQQLGFNIFIVLESPRELDLVLQTARQTGIRPQLGVRIKLTHRVSGKWSQSSGDRSTFGLTIPQVMDVLATLKQTGYLDCLVLQHSHLGSQVPNIIEIRKATQEACKFFTEIRSEGAPLAYLDLGGGLGVDYTGQQIASTNSINYSLREYCLNIIETVKDIMNAHDMPHPVIITESGRACVAQSSMLIFDVLEATHFDSDEKIYPAADDHPMLTNMLEIETYLTRARVQECWNDLRYYRDEVRSLFQRNQVGLAMTAKTERAYLYLMNQIKNLLRDSEEMSHDMLQALEEVADIYHCNFSLFQSLPDVWAIDQIHPIAPIQRLNEKPMRAAILSDITCDSDGKIDNFVLADGISGTLPVHDLKPDEEYYLGVFFVGAYQETLGDLHNLFGDTNVVTIELQADGGFELMHEQEGDKVSEVLSYVEYDPRRMVDNFKTIVEKAVQSGRLSPDQRREMTALFKDSMNGYTYYES